jgi:hypothetical protein
MGQGMEACRRRTRSEMRAGEETDNQLEGNQDRISMGIQELYSLKLHLIPPAAWARKDCYT